MKIISNFGRKIMWKKWKKKYQKMIKKRKNTGGGGFRLWNKVQKQSLHKPTQRGLFLLSHLKLGVHNQCEGYSIKNERPIQIKSKMEQAWQWKAMWHSIVYMKLNSHLEESKPRMLGNLLLSSTSTSRYEII